MGKPAKAAVVPLPQQFYRVWQVSLGSDQKLTQADGPNTWWDAPVRSHETVRPLARRCIQQPCHADAQIHVVRMKPVPLKWWRQGCTPNSSARASALIAESVAMKQSGQVSSSVENGRRQRIYASQRRRRTMNSKIRLGFGKVFDVSHHARVTAPNIVLHQSKYHADASARYLRCPRVVVPSPLS
jgi:hypothetical protein